MLRISEGIRVAFIFLLALSPIPASAGNNAWTSNGPYGGIIEALAVDPSSPQTLYAGTDKGVYKSANGGESWTKINAGLTDTYIYSLAIDPSNPQTIYAGTLLGGVFKSANGGES